MKKIIALALALILTLTCFTACSAKTPAADTDLAKIKANGKIIVGITEYAPMDFKDENGEWTGFDAEFAQLFAEELGVECEFYVIADWGKKFLELDTNQIDAVWNGMTITEDRLKEVDFSISYATGVQAIIVKEGSAITCVDDLFAEDAAYKVAVQLGTTGDIYATGDFGEELVTQYNNGNEAVLALIGGDVDCVIIDNEPAKAFVAENEGLVILDTSYADEDYAACFAKGNEALLDAVNQAIEELIMDGTIDSIIEKYIPAE